MSSPLTPSDAALLEATEDPLTYIERFLSIRDMNDQVIPFVLNPVQRKILELKERAADEGKARRFIVLKARREGVTTLEQALNFWLVATKPNRQAGTLAHDAESTEKTFRIANLFYDRLDSEFRPRRRPPHFSTDVYTRSTHHVLGIGQIRGLQRSVPQTLGMPAVALR